MVKSNKNGLRPWASVPGHKNWTAAVLAKYGTVCWLQYDGCTQIATTGDHVIPRSQRPDLELDVSNGRPACLKCNRRRRNRPAPVEHQVVDRLGLFTVDRLGILMPHDESRDL